MLVLIAGLVVFFGVHSVRMVMPQWRDARHSAMGEKAYKGAYSLISFVGLALMVWGWMLYRPEAVQVYVPPAWGRHVAMLFVLLAFVLVAASSTPTGYIKAAVRHPMVLGVLLWSAGHLLANGDMAGVILFGVFLAYTILNFFSVAGRDAEAPVSKGARGDVLAIVAGALGYAVFVFWLHELLFGVSPLS